MHTLDWRAISIISLKFHYISIIIQIYTHKHNIHRHLRSDSEGFCVPCWFYKHIQKLKLNSNVESEFLDAILRNHDDVKWAFGSCWCRRNDVDAWGLWGWYRIAMKRKIIIKMFKFIKIRVMWIYGFNFTRLIFFWNTKAWILYYSRSTTKRIRRRRQRCDGGGLERQPVWRDIRNGVKGWWHVELFKIFFTFSVQSPFLIGIFIIKRLLFA